MANPEGTDSTDAIQIEKEGFQCQLCGKRFLTKRALWGHKETHAGE